MKYKRKVGFHVRGEFEGQGNLKERISPWSLGARKETKGEKKQRKRKKWVPRGWGSTAFIKVSQRGRKGYATPLVGGD